MKILIVAATKSEIISKIISSNNKGLIVKPEGGCNLEFLIQKKSIAINPADSRSSRFVGGERIDAAIAEIDLPKRKVVLSIKLLEELQKLNPSRDQAKKKQLAENELKALQKKLPLTTKERENLIAQLKVSKELL